MSKSILLARPHPFIFREMKPLLEECRYAVLKPDSLADIDKYGRNCDAAVISLAVVSDIRATAEEVTDRIYRINPRMPVIFASLLPFDRAAASISLLLTKLGMAARIEGVSSSSSMPSATPGFSVLYLAKDELTDTATREKAKRLLQRYISQR